VVAFASLLIVITLSILITRIATVALTHTGLSREAARFQARSAFTGVGFTTSEAESIVNHPVRRRIVLLLMLLGSAGLVTAMASLILSFTAVESSGSFAVRILLLVAGLGVLWIVASSRWVDTYASKLISWALDRYTSLGVKDYASLLNLTGDYEITEVKVDPDDWMANRTVGELRFRDEGILVLGIKRADGTYRGAPKGPTKIFPDDTLVLYGRARLLGTLGQRERGERGDREHERAVAEQKEVSRQQEKEDHAGQMDERETGT